MNSSFVNSNIKNASFKNAILSNSRFDKARLDGIDFSYCDLREVSFWETEFKGEIILDQAIISTLNWFEELEKQKATGINIVLNQYQIIPKHDYFILLKIK